MLARPLEMLRRPARASVVAAVVACRRPRPLRRPRPVVRGSCRVAGAAAAPGAAAPRTLHTIINHSRGVAAAR